MLFEFNLYSSLLLIFFVHIFVYAILFIKRGCEAERWSDKLLGAFLVIAALYIVPWMTGFAGWYDARGTFYRNLLFYTPFVHSLFIGPLLYLYVQSITNTQFKMSRQHWLHLLPGLIYLLWNGVVVIVDKVILKRYYLMNGIEDPDFDDWYVTMGLVSMLTYFILAIRYYRKYRTYISYELSYPETVSLKWLRNFLYAFLAFVIITIIFRIISAATNLNYSDTWWYYFTFGLIVYYMAIAGFHAVTMPLRKLVFEPRLLVQYQPVRLLAPATTVDAGFELVAGKEDWIEAWKEKAEALMQGTKLYLEPELTLTEMSQRLKTNPSLVSKVINKAFGSNFNDYVNRYRVEEVKLKFSEGSHLKQTLVGVAFDCGFNSKATFNRAFKSLPVKARKNILKIYRPNLRCPL